MKKKIAILGATGSIGRSALDVISHHPDRLQVGALTTHSRVDDLVELCQTYKPPLAGVTRVEPTAQQRAAIAQCGTRLFEGPDALCQIARADSIDTVLLAVVGSAGVPAAVAAINAGKALALANKESLALAGSILMPLAREKSVPIIPLDSEHSAIFQCLQAGRHSEISRVILTASGGALREASVADMNNATAEDALRHPTWNMGAKVTVDSATMFNKALEVIEACWLFDLPPDKVEVVVHPQSVVHSMVEFVDGSTIAQLSPPDMRTPIQYALTYPDRLPGRAPRLDLTSHMRLDSFPPDLNRYPALALGYEVVRTGGGLGAVFNAANEVAVSAFLNHKIRLGMIYSIVSGTMKDFRSLEPRPHAERVTPAGSIDDLLGVDAWAREHAQRVLVSALGR